MVECTQTTITTARRRQAGTWCASARSVLVHGILSRGDKTCICALTPFKFRRMGSGKGNVVWFEERKKETTRRRARLAAMYGGFVQLVQFNTTAPLFGHWCVFVVYVVLLVLLLLLSKLFSFGFYRRWSAWDTHTQSERSTRTERGINLYEFIFRCLVDSRGLRGVRKLVRW